MQKRVLLLILLFSQALADLNMNLTSPSACTTTQGEDGNTVESKLYGYSGYLVEFLKFIPLPGAAEVDEILSDGYDIWVRKNILCV